MESDETEEKAERVPLTKRGRSPQIVDEDEEDVVHNPLTAPLYLINSTPLVFYGSSPIKSDEEIPVPKRSRQGTIGPEVRAQILAACAHLQQQPSTCKSSTLELLGTTQSYVLYSFFGQPRSWNG